MKRVKPRYGIILAGIPAEGAEISDELAKEWIANGLVTLVKDEPKLPKTPTPERENR